MHTPLPTFRSLLDNDFPQNSLRRKHTGTDCLTGVSLIPPPHKVTPLNPFSFPEGGGFHFVRPQGVTMRPIHASEWVALRVEFQTERSFSDIYKKRGRGVSDQATPHLCQNETPPPMAYPPYPFRKILSWGGLPMRPPSRNVAYLATLSGYPE